MRGAPANTARAASAGTNMRCQIVKPDGTIIEFEGVQTFSPEQVEWFKAGSALNVVRRKVAEGSL
jgi:aconitate hydratase